MDIYKTKWMSRFGFAKSDRANISASDLSSWRDLAADWLEQDALTIKRAVFDGSILEVYDDEDASEPDDASHS